jgi:protein-S-isoprenylcysteine O-methyltransferase Ste14
MRSSAGGDRFAPRNRVRPTFVFAAAFLGGLAADVWLAVPGPATIFGRSGTQIGATTLLCLGASITIACLDRFRRLRTGIMPHEPARAVVDRGAYAWSRNPMFLGFALIHSGLALLVDASIALAMLPVAMRATSALVIRHEEAYMLRRFGGEYERYRDRVHRWLGRRRQTGRAPGRVRRPALWSAGSSSSGSGPASGSHA